MELPIQVHNQTRVAGQHGRCVEALGQGQRDLLSADIAGHMAPEYLFLKPEPLQAGWNFAAGMVTHQ